MLAAIWAFQSPRQTLDGGWMDWRVWKNSPEEQRTLLGAEARGQGGLTVPREPAEGCRHWFHDTFCAQTNTSDAEPHSPLPPGTLAPPPSLPGASPTPAPSFISST